MLNALCLTKALKILRNAVMCTHSDHEAMELAHVISGIRLLKLQIQQLNLNKELAMSISTLPITKALKVLRECTPVNAEECSKAMVELKLIKVQIQYANAAAEEHERLVDGFGD